jgi:hypothetical protein
MLLVLKPIQEKRQVSQPVNYDLGELIYTTPSEAYATSLNISENTFILFSVHWSSAKLDKRGLQEYISICPYTVLNNIYYTLTYH